MSAGKTHRVLQSAGNVTMTCRTAFAALLTLTFAASIVAVMGEVAAAQSYPLSEVEVRLVRTPHGGCFGPCSIYAVTVRGDGTVTYDGTVIYSGAGQVAGVRTRSISVDEVVSLVNEFLRARFFDAPVSYCGESLIVRKGDTVTMYGSCGADEPQTDLTLRIGDRRKTVTLYSNYPADLGRLPELVESIGGPQVWLR
jgi:Domain of unknown function (DUF6438)